MPQLDFVIDSLDEEEIIKHLFKRDIFLVPNFNDTQSPTCITNWDEYITRRQEKLFFLISDSFMKCPLELSRVEGGYYEGFYSVSQRVGGPTIDMYVCRPFVRDNRRYLGSSFISYYTTYKNSNTGEMENAPDELIACYRDIASWIKKNAYLAKGEKRRYWLRPNALNSLRTESQMGILGFPKVP